MLSRRTDLQLVRAALKRSRIVAILGPRQSGKTTLARQFVPASSLNYFDLEDPRGLARLSEPDVALRSLKGLIVIDEVQRRPDLFPLLRVLADRRPLLDQPQQQDRSRHRRCRDQPRRCDGPRRMRALPAL